MGSKRLTEILERGRWRYKRRGVRLAAGPSWHRAEVVVPWI